MSPTVHTTDLAADLAADQAVSRSNLTRAIALLLIVTLSGLSGCVSSAYQPKNKAYLAQIQRGGAQVYVVDGRTYPGGYFSGGLVDATAPIPRAQNYAIASQSSAFTFIGLYIGGITVTFGAVPFFVADLASGERGTTPSSLIGSTLLTAGIAALAGSIWAGTRMEARRLDAINAFNDMRWRSSSRRFRRSDSRPPSSRRRR